MLAFAVFCDFYSDYGDFWTFKPIYHKAV